MSQEEEIVAQDAEAVQKLGHAREQILDQLGQVIVGQHQVIEELLISPLPNGIILAGYVTGALLRGLMVGAVVMAVSLFFTRIDVQYPLIMLSVLVLTAVVFALGWGP